MNTPTQSADAWECFFLACLEAWKTVQARRAAREAAQAETEPPAQEKCA